MILTKTQILLITELFKKYPDASLVHISQRANGSGIGPDDVAVFQDRGNLFRKIAPKVYGEEDITDVSLW